MNDMASSNQTSAPHAPLAPWRSRLTPAIDERRARHVAAARRLAGRLFAERPKALRRRLEALWENGWQILKDLHPHIFNNGFYPAGNVPVLQTLGKGSISMAPVWSDQSLSYLAQKLLPPEIKLLQIDPPFAGSAAYLGIPSDSKNKDVLYEFLNWLLTPEPQNLIVEQINGYPGLDWKYMPADVQQKYADVAKAYSFEFSPQFNTDRNKQWYEKVAGTPPPA